MKISILKSGNNDSIYEHNEGHLVKEDFSSKILLSKVIVASIYAFGLGYSLFYTGDDFIEVGIKFLVLLIVLYILIEIPYAFFKALLLPNVFKEDIVKLELNPYTMSISISSRKTISKDRVLISSIIPFIIFSLGPTIISYILEFNIYLYAIASVIAIISVKDLYFAMVLIRDDSIGENLILTPFEYIDADISRKEISVDLDNNNNLEYKDEFCYQLLENVDKSKTKNKLDKNKEPEYLKEMILNVDNNSDE